MTNRRKIVLGGVEFPSQKAVKEYCQHLLRTTPAGPLPAAAEAVIADLLAMHPAVETKTCPGVDAIFVRIDPEWHRPQFCVSRTDGTTTSFSCRSCLAPTTPRTNFSRACRRAVERDIIAFKAEAFSGEDPADPITGELLSWSGCHVHHEPPVFESIVEAFISITGIDPATVTYANGVQGCRFADADVERRFQAYHRQHARLVLLSVKSHESVTHNNQETVQ